jgi:Na+/H+ antiporter NhaC
MLAAEGRAFLKSTDICETPALKNSELPPKAKTSFVWLPLVILGGVLGLSLGPLGFPFVAISGPDFRAGLSTAYVYAAVSLVLLMAFYKVRSTMDSLKVYLNGMGRMMHVAALLILAWALSDLLSEIGADTYISQVVVANIAPGLFAVLIFMTSCLISFATGSSWGTFAIMFPLIVPAAFAISAPLSVCIGAVLSGGLFGDHCSPISETTILSSMGAGCEPIEHFRTQLPYALANGFLSLIGFLMAGFYPNAGILMVLIALQGLAIFSLRKHVNMK